MPFDLWFMCGVLEGIHRKRYFIDLCVKYAQLNVDKVMIFIISLQKRLEMTMSETV